MVVVILWHSFQRTQTPYVLPWIETAWDVLYYLYDFCSELWLMSIVCLSIILFFIFVSVRPGLWWCIQKWLDDNDLFCWCNVRWCCLWYPCWQVWSKTCCYVSITLFWYCGCRHFCVEDQLHCIYYTEIFLGIFNAGKWLLLMNDQMH